MTIRRAHEITEEPGHFLSARRACMHGRRVRNLISPVVRGLLLIGMLAVAIISRDPILIIFGIIFFLRWGSSL
ncbi:hypothetical protein [Actinophytocola algeriensis]|uniref:Uncharacterized protein n=1 Tax=Actinophytocola algeriensis TaxID=1768010 RepID=A0A7W7QDJ5_9PSEU|nr:hypothetical protein [Actinophytocola algeriensis]MBB4911299.1 hypothetical protein [Actinophytocola algeriensis]MBE1479238.1 hypothetical protein [Actinophytocola algeriensis]